MITIRQAVVNDIPMIHDLISRYALQELLLPKSRAQLVVRLPNTIVAEHDGQFAGSIAFKIDADEKAEIVSWVVDGNHFNNGIGSTLLLAVIKRIEDLGIRTIYTLTLRRSIFEKYGFEEISMEKLPKKVWTDCIHCPRNIAKPGSVDCKETALIKNP